LGFGKLLGGKIAPNEISGSLARKNRVAKVEFAIFLWSKVQFNRTNIRNQPNLSKAEILVL
jgi:hypothetical protein